jgi:protein phosphatase
VPVVLRAAAVSDVGGFRSVNQDAAFTAPWGAAVADGVGGGPSGDLASAAFVHRLVAGGMLLTDAGSLAVRIREANWDLGAHTRRDESLRGMATTFTGLFVSNAGRLLLAHTGDSRAYLLRRGVLTRETRDDSYVQALLDRGLIAPEAAASHPRRNLITASLSGGEGDAVTVADRDPVPGDRWLLCSDGVTDYLTDDDLMRELFGAASAQAAASSIVDLALEAGSRDNVTAVVCDVGESDETALHDLHARRQTEFYGAAAERFCEELDTA